MINLGTGQPLNEFPDLTKDEASRVIRDAQTAVEEASQEYRSSMSGRVNILGQGIDVGAPAVNLPDIECTDLMPVKDCQLLFNVCDPVICPSSRCDLGGLYPVRDVIQTGIIGSLVLCWPNFQEGIFIPICLTGVQAGIDGWLSVKTSYRDCLQNALDTGEMVGICDEIYSIYMCEFFWRQVLPLADLSIPRIVGVLMGQNTRGGGEYLFAENAWNSAKDSVTYFTQYYGANSNQAFKARTTEEVGTEICKVSVSAVYASGADIIDTLAEPDSPVQFHGRFDEIPFSSATVPPTSHYKVFYHVYAGKDSGAYYQVYLKGIPESSYYQDSSSTLIIASGYAETGGYASETRDLTAVSGYQQLCINVNGQEECGFNEVSTSFAIDYVSDQYVAWQVRNVDIKTERQCIRADNLGIIRICGTDNPGKGSDGAWDSEDSRWKEVGYCGDEEILCWLDTESVEDAIDISFIGEEALENVTQNYLDILREREGYLLEEQFASSVEGINDELDASQRLILIANIFDKVFLNNEKAHLFLLRGNAYAELAIEAFAEQLRREAERAAAAASDDDEGEEGDEKIEIKERSYGIDEIGFSLNGGIAEFEEDVVKYSKHSVELVVRYEENCEYVEYRVFSPREGTGLFSNIWTSIQNIFNWNPISAGIDKNSMDSLLNTLPEGNYRVRGYCFNEEGEETDTTDSNKLVVQETPGTAIDIPSVFERYDRLAWIFSKYASESGNLPQGLEPNRFKALLVAIAVRQSNLGYPEGIYDPEWLMEYGWSKGSRMPQYAGPENQVGNASRTLQSALQKDFEEGLYSGCNGRIKLRDPHFICVISVYLTGQRSRILASTTGEAYAKEVMDIMDELVKYFDDTEGEWWKEDYSETPDNSEEVEPSGEVESSEGDSNENSDDYEVPPGLLEE
jgi:hypothetical protein